MMLRRSVAAVHRLPCSALCAVRWLSGTVSNVVSAADVAHMIKDEATITVGGRITSGIPEAVLAAIVRRYKATKHPQNLTVVFGGKGDWDGAGLEVLATPGLIRRVGSDYRLAAIGLCGMSRYG